MKEEDKFLSLVEEGRARWMGWFELELGVGMLVVGRQVFEWMKLHKWQIWCLKSTIFMKPAILKYTS